MATTTMSVKIIVLIACKVKRHSFEEPQIYVNVELDYDINIRRKYIKPQNELMPKFCTKSQGLRIKKYFAKLHIIYENCNISIWSP